MCNNSLLGSHLDSGLSIRQDRGQEPSNHECPDHIGAVSWPMQGVRMSSRHKEKSSTFLQLMSRYRLTERQYNKQVSDIHLERLSRSGCKQWKSLPPHLELEAIVAEDIDKSQKGERGKRHEFLLTWKEMEGSGATYKQLITALLKIKCRQDAEKLCEMLKKSAKSQLAILQLTVPHLIMQVKVQEFMLNASL